MNIKDKIREIEELNNSRVICYITNDNHLFTGNIGDDIYIQFYEILEKMGNQERIDLFIYSRGGNTLVPWKLVNILREFTNNFNVLVPFHSNSSATMIALGADKIYMGKMADISPIDPTITSPYNPAIPGKEGDPRARLGLSVEDVMSYYELARDTMNLKEETSLLKSFELLSNKVHPIALGNVNRSHNQIRMLAKKLLCLHLDNEGDHLLIEKIIEYLTQKLYNHGHLINRKEAMEILSDRMIEFPNKSLEKRMWELFKLYRDNMMLNQSFDISDVHQKFKQCDNPIDLNTVKTISPYVVNGVIACIESVDISYECVKQVQFKPQFNQIPNSNPPLYHQVGLNKEDVFVKWTEKNNSVKV